MEKFTKMKKEPEAQIPASLFQCKNFTITGDENSQIINESDAVVILPYFKEEGYILLRHDDIPGFKQRYGNDLKNKNINRFLTVMSSQMMEGETPIQAVRRELHASSGVILSNLYPLKADDELFISRGGTAKYHIFLLELNYNDFKQVMSVGAQSKNAALCVRVSVGDIDDIQVHDIITKYMLLKLKFEYKIK